MIIEQMAVAAASTRKWDAGRRCPPGVSDTQRLLRNVRRCGVMQSGLAVVIDGPDVLAAPQETQQFRHVGWRVPHCGGTHCTKGNIAVARAMMNRQSSNTFCIRGRSILIGNEDFNSG
jgi:hypothetical protein